MRSPLLGSFSGPFIAWWLFFVLAPPQSGGPPSKTILRSADDSITRQAQESGEMILYFPDYVDGEGWSVQLVLSNVDPEAAAEVRVDVYDPEGQPIRDLFDSDLTLEIPALGSRVLRSAGSGAIRRGWIQVQTDSAAVGGLLTYRNAQTGIEVGVKPVDLGPQFALFVEESPTVGAGVAVFKPDASPRLELRIRGEEGNDPLEGGFVPWRDFHQAARTLPEWFSGEGVDTGFLTDFRGLLFLESEDESPFAPLGLRFGKGTSSLSAVPAIRTHGEEPKETNLVFPDYVDGGGWSVQLVLSNVDADTAAEVRVEVHDSDGQPVLDLFESNLTLEIPALGSRVLRSAGAGAMRRGWIQVESDSALVSGLLTYRHVQTGIEVSVEPVQLGKEFALFVEESGTVGAGLALFNPDAESRIELRLRDEEGNDPLDGVFLPWRDFHQAARTLPEWFDIEGVDTEFLRDFRGLLFLRAEGESGFAPLGLRFGKGTSSLSAVPAIRLPEGGGIDGGLAPPPTVTLAASPTSIDRGQSTTLTWSSTSAESAEITPDIGVVPTSGTRKVSPNVTTTYRITVTGADGQTATASVTVAISERVLLRAVFDAMGGSAWTRSDNWLTDAPLGEWYGVEVDSQGRVIGLRMAEWVETEDGRRVKIGNRLTGSIPPELGSLSHLRVLNLSENRLTGPIPPELGQLSNLQRLDLSVNALTGPIPPELGRLSNLRVLDLGRNNLESPIRPELGALAQLEFLHLGSNDLRGPIPPELGRLSNLKVLDLGRDRLTGPIPPELGQLSNLQRLDLSGNRLTGPIPPELGQLSNLQRLDLSGNRLTGPIPPELGRLSNLRVLDLGWNNLESPIRPELGALAQLEFLDLGSNLLRGPIPPELGRLSNLRVLDLGGNNLRGPIRPELGVLAQLEFLDLGLNLLRGPIPPELGRLSNLRVLDLGGNDNLRGPIPPELGRLSKLKMLNLSGVNRYRYEENRPPLDYLPLAGLSGLTWLDLGHNHTPDLSSLAGLTKLAWLNLEYNGILDVSPLAGLLELEYLNGGQNRIADISPFAGLTNLREAVLSSNDISNLEPLTANTGLGAGSVVDVRANPLSSISIRDYVPALQGRGVTVLFDDIKSFSDPEIYNDNVFVLPVDENLAAGGWSAVDWTRRFYEYFNDEFDFLVFVLNLYAEELDDPASNLKSSFIRSHNDVQGIGLRNSSDYRFPAALQGVVVHGTVSFSINTQSIIYQGPMLHELMHRWANFITPSSGQGSHWGFSSADGILGGFDIAKLVDHGDGRYTAGYFSRRGVAANDKPYSPIELYLAGLVPPEEVPDLWVAEDGEWLLGEGGNHVTSADGEMIFTASQIRTYTIDDIVRMHGSRVPDSSHSQREFRAATILLVDDHHPAKRRILDQLSDDVSWFSQAASDDDREYNFYEATGGRATIDMNDLPRSQR